MFDATPAGNRGIWEQIIEAGPTVRGEFIFPLGQSGFIDSGGLPERQYRQPARHLARLALRSYAPRAEDLPPDPDGDVDNDGVLDGFEKWYFGSNSPAPSSDADGDGLNLLGEYYFGSDPTDADTDDDGFPDAADNCAASRNPGQQDLDGDGAETTATATWTATTASTPTRSWRTSCAEAIATSTTRMTTSIRRTTGRTASTTSCRRDQYFKDDNDGNPDSSRTSAGLQPGHGPHTRGPELWEPGPPNGLQRIDDILNQLHQYFHDCS